MGHIWPPLRETLEFVLEYLPSSGKVLEVGCGDGDLAAALASRGLDMVALDSDPLAIAETREKGLDARLTDFSEFEEPGFSAIIFSRSLHHIHPLDEAVERAWHLLRPGGQLLVEEFGRELVNSAGVSWRYGVESLLRAAGLQGGREDTQEAGDPLDRWLKEYSSEHLSESGAMRQALASRFQIVVETTVPYLYRCCLPGLDRTGAASSVAEQLLSWEAELIEMGVVAPVGVRWVGVRRESTP